MRLAEVVDLKENARRSSTSRVGGTASTRPLFAFFPSTLLFVGPLQTETRCWIWYLLTALDYLWAFPVDLFWRNFRKMYVPYNVAYLRFNIYNNCPSILFILSSMKNVPNCSPVQIRMGQVWVLSLLWILYLIYILKLTLISETLNRYLNNGLLHNSICICSYWFNNLFVQKGHTRTDVTCVMWFSTKLNICHMHSAVTI